MESRIANALGVKYHPVAVLLENEKPDDALQFKKGRGGASCSSSTYPSM